MTTNDNSYNPAGPFAYIGKRPLIYSPLNNSAAEADAPQIKEPPLKRQCSVPTPEGHMELVATRKLGREELRKWNESISKMNPCPVHSSVTRQQMAIPMQAFTFLQSQGASINRTNEAVLVLSGQVTDLTEKLDSAIKRFGTPPPRVSPQPYNRQPNKTSTTLLRPQQSPIIVNLPLLTSYHTIITETLENFKKIRDAEVSRLSSSSSVLLQPTWTSSISASQSQQYDVIRKTVDCISKIRDLMILQCNFDCFDELGSGIPINSTLMNGPMVSSTNSILARDSTRVTWNVVYAALQRMESNVRTYVDCVGGSYRPRPQGVTNLLSDTLLRTSAGPHQPLFTSTPLKRDPAPSTTARNARAPRPSPSNPQKKRRCEDDTDFVGLNSGDPWNTSMTQGVGGMRTKLTPRRISFFYDRETRMEVD